MGASDPRIPVPHSGGRSPGSLAVESWAVRSLQGRGQTGGSLQDAGGGRERPEGKTAGV